MSNTCAVQRRRGTLVLGASIAAMASAGLSPAFAQCAPDPTQANVITTCSGVDADGLTVTANNSIVEVQAGGTVQRANSPAIIVNMPVVNTYFGPRLARIDVAGTVDGIQVLSGPVGAGLYDYYGSDVTITVAAGGIVDGETGIDIARSGGSGGGRVTARIDNAGTITGSAGPALTAAGADTAFQITNRAGGTIGGISGPVSGLDNAGTIDGGAYSAIAGGFAYSATGSRDWVNDGTIRSNSTAATIDALAVSGGPFINNGTIANDGSGRAIAGQSFSLTNTASAVISAAGGTAIESDFYLQLVNTGRIEGNVVVGTASFSGASSIDTVGGIIDGDLILGTGSDRIVARYAGTSTLQAGVTGRIDGGAGSDTVAVRIGTDTKIDTAINLFDNFEQLTLELQGGATVTLADGFVPPASIQLEGQGTLVNAGTFAGSGTLLRAQISGGFPYSALAVVNTGTLRSAPGQGFFAVELYDATATFTNAGAVETAGSGIWAAALTNTGTITSGGTAVFTSNSGPISNSGIIRSTGGTALNLVGSFGPVTATSSGLIDGALVGASLYSGLANSGTIRSAGTGVQLQSGGFIDNLAGGIITGGTRAISGSSSGSTTVRNAGTITGVVDLGDNSGFGLGQRFFAAAGGVLDGNLVLGRNATLVTELVNTGPGRFAGINGTVTGSDATLRYEVRSSTSTTLAPSDVFRTTGYQLWNNAALTVTGTPGADRTLEFAGAGTVDLTADLTTNGRTAIGTTSIITATNDYSDAGSIDLISRGAVSMSSGTGNQLSYTAVTLRGQDRFTNAGTISVRGQAGSFAPTAISGGTIINSGTIRLDNAIGVSGLSLVNNGRIEEVAGSQNAIAVAAVPRVQNNGTISVNGVAVRTYDYTTLLDLTNAAGATIASSSGAAVRAFGGTVTNAGTITGTVDLGYAQSFSGTPDRAYATGRYIAAGGTVSGDVLFGRNSDVFVQTGDMSGVSGTIDGGAGEDLYLHTVATSRTVSLDSTPRLIGFEHMAVEVTGAEAVATLTGATQNGNLTVRGIGTVANTATINGSLTTYGNYPVSYLLGDMPATLARLDNRGTITGDVTGIIGTLVNSGTIGGQVVLDAAANRVENLGTITGAVLLGAGNDTFVQHGGAMLAGVVSGGAGDDLFVMAADKTGALSASQITRFERIMQTGTETIAWSGNFATSTIELEGGTLAVAAGQTLSTRGPVTITGGDAGVAVRNEGTIAGAVRLGAGNDRYVEGPNAAAGTVDGGAGINTYGVMLAGDRTGIDPRSNFQQLAVEGTGTLSLTLDQDFARVELAGTRLAATLNGHTIGRIDGSAAAERVAVDGDVALVALGAGDDLLQLGAANLAGAYAGGAGSDTLRLAAAGPVVLSGTATQFELLELNSGALTVTGMLGAAGETLTFGEGAQTLTLAVGGRLPGSVSLGAGDDRFRLDRSGIFTGTVSGGSGTNVAELAVTDGLTLTGSLRDFAQVVATGSGTLTIARGTTLATSQLLLGAGSGRLAIEGAFAGGVSGQGGRPVIAVTGGNAAAPVAFTNLSNIAELQVAGGWSTLADRATLDRLAMSGGRFVGLAGSTLSAGQITVGSGATFGSAGTVNGNLTVAGTLSPGASPGTMVVNGNVALAAGSTSVFEITPAASDLLRINGALTIAQGATLQLVADQRVAPGQSLELITATGGITGSYTNVVRPASLFGFVVQDAQRIALVGAFLNDPAFAPPVQGAVAYVNDLLTAGLATPALLAAVPLLLDPAGTTSADAFARLTPQPYAAATQLAVEQGLELARTARSDAFAAPGDTPGSFAFAAVLGRTDELGGGAGIARARSDSYGVVGGLGWGSRTFSVGAFVGTLDQRQDLRALGARTDTDGLVAGVHARWSGGTLGVNASIAYADGDATTTRPVPGGRATGGYDLTGWTADLALDYALPLANGWTVRPGIGATAIRATRQRTAEGGDTAFLLDVARDRHEAVFVDGSVTMMRDRAATIRPHLTAGLRYRVDGDRPGAFAALPGGPLTLSAFGAARAALTAHGALGAEASVTRNLTLFGSVAGQAGENTSQGSGQVGMRVSF